MLRKLFPEKPFVETNPRDTAKLGIGPNDKVLIESRRGGMYTSAFLTHAVQQGHVFVPMHYEQTNRLTFSAFDPFSGQAAYKACAVRVSTDI